MCQLVDPVDVVPRTLILVCCKKLYRLKSIFVIPDRRFLGLGFGGTVNGRVSHCFPLNGKSRDPYCQGIDGVINAYYDSLAHGKMI